ncbi:MAG TPA: hypothetical protein VG035_04935, partial [Actinomycetota bacterium]|nr:hypothetical protein [Actinomycetota bacterium]
MIVVELPTGTVTLVFTDIEGSTRLLRSLGDDYGRVLRAHRAILREAVARNGGSSSAPRATPASWPSRRPPPPSPPPPRPRSPWPRPTGRAGP